MITFWLDVNNELRLKIRNSEMDTQLKEDIQAFKREGIKLHIDIKNLGILEIDAVIPDFKNKAVIIKSTLILDYTKLSEEELATMGAV